MPITGCCGDRMLVRDPQGCLHLGNRWHVVLSIHHAEVLKAAQGTYGSGFNGQRQEPNGSNEPRPHGCAQVREQLRTATSNVEQTSPIISGFRGRLPGSEAVPWPKPQVRAAFERSETCQGSKLRTAAVRLSLGTCHQRQTSEV